MSVEHFGTVSSRSNRVIAVLVYLLLIATVSQAQRTNGEVSVWFYPALDSNGLEKGSFDELTDKRRVYVTFFHGSGQTQNNHVLEQVVIQGVKQYDGLEIVDDPESAHFAIHIQMSPIVSSTTSDEQQSFTMARRMDIAFFVLIRGEMIGVDKYKPRIIVRNTFSANEGSTSLVSTQVGSLIKRMKELRGE